MVKVAVVAPAATVTEAGTVALAVLLASATAMPPVGAGLLIVTVPVELAPPITEVGLRETDDADGGVTVRVAEPEVVPSVALIVAVVEAATAVVPTVKEALVAPAATVTNAGSVALALLELSETLEPPVGAGPFRVTVPVDEFPPATEVGLKATD